MNKVVLMGRLTRDPEWFEAKSSEGVEVCRYTLAIPRRSKPDEADFVDIVSFGKLADMADTFFKKGMRVCISGSLQSGSYKNKDGNTVYTLNVIADSQEFASDKKDDSDKRGRRR